MSPKPLVAVWRDAIRDDPDLSTTATSVGWCLATYLNSRTGFGWPSVVLLAAGSKWSARTAGRAVNELEAKGYLEIDRSKGR